MLLSLFFLVLSPCIWVADAQLPIPARFDGFVYTNSRASPDSIFIEAFFDPVCPDSRDAWPPLKQLLDHYGSRLSLVVHPFALPSVTINPPSPLAMWNFNCQLGLCDIHESNWQVLWIIGNLVVSFFVEMPLNFPLMMTAEIRLVNWLFWKLRLI